jgi:hypothetical protein
VQRRRLRGRRRRGVGVGGGKGVIGLLVMVVVGSPSPWRRWKQGGGRRWHGVDAVGHGAAD